MCRLYAPLTLTISLAVVHILFAIIIFEKSLDLSDTVTTDAGTLLQNLH